MTTNINPANIDSNYPIAGQDNDSQGFRTNFTVIKNNLTSAASEITDLQNKAILKSPLLGTTEVNNDLGNTLLTRAVTRGFSGAVRDHDIMTGPVDVLFLDGPMHKVETSGSISLDITWPQIAAIPTVDAACLTLRVWVNITDIAHTVTLPAAPVILHGTDALRGYSGGTVVPERSTAYQGGLITFDASGDYLFEFSTANAGDEVFVKDLSRASATSNDLALSGNLTVTGAITGELATAAQPNITSVGTLTSLDVSGAITGTFEGPVGDTTPAAGAFTTLSAANGINGELATAAQPNITSVGTLTSLAVTGATTTGGITTGNATVNGGTINNTTIGAVTPGTGVFTTLSTTTSLTSSALFTAAGRAKLPVATPTNIGVAGDDAGMVASDSTNLYVCVAPFDGVSAIWTKITLSPI